MVRRIHLAVLAAAALTLIVLPSPVHACSIVREWLYRPGTYFIAAPLPEVVTAGPGDVRHFPGHPGRSVDSTTAVAGQRVRLEDVGGAIAPPLARAMRQGVREAVLVPWGYGADCRTIRWDGAMPWLDGNTAGLFSGKLREERHWVEGLPTFDVMSAYGEPYPHAGYRGKPSDPGSVLSAGHLFALYNVLPMWSRDRPVTYEQVEPLFRWARENPELARLHPVPDALESAYREVQPCRSAVETSPVAGTYRLQVVAGEAEPREIFIRTSARPSSPRCAAEVQMRDPGRLAPRSADSYHLYVHGAGRLADIPETNRDANRGGCGVARLKVSESPRTTATGVQVWTARLDLEMLQRCFPGDEPVGRALDHYRAMFDGGTAAHLGEVRVRADGSAELEQVLEMEGREVLSVRGERLPGAVLTY